MHFQPQGFRNSGVDASVVANGTYFTNPNWLPAIGYQPRRELNDAGERRAAWARLAPRCSSLADVEARRIRVGGDASPSKQSWARTRIRSRSRRGCCAGHGRKAGAATSTTRQMPRSRGERFVLRRVCGA